MNSEPLPPDLAEALLVVRPRLGRLGEPLVFFSTVGSTNDIAAELIAAGHSEGATVIAGAQTSGRGRRGHRWFSPPVGGLYVSVVLTPSRARLDAARATSLLTIAAGVALAEAVESTTGLSPAIKWPNDLLAGTRKVAGILAEGVSSPASAGGRVDTVIVGYGINVGPMTFPQELARRATSLEAELGRAIDRAAVCAASLAALAGRYDDLIAGRFDAILDHWRRRAPGSEGARVTWHGPAGPQSGTTAGVDDCGALLVRTSARVERIVAGEVVWG